MEKSMTSSAGYGVVPLDEVRGMSGLELMTGLIEGRFPAPPIAEVLNFFLVEASSGRAVFEGTPVLQHYNPLGSVHGGVAATLLDSAMGCAVHTTLKAGIGFTTLEIKVNYVRAMTEKTGKVRCEGRTINVGSRIATAEGKLIDPQGKLLAHGTTTCLIFPI
jgi:uncharacterized protein (TIGR00369 family)